MKAASAEVIEAMTIGVAQEAGIVLLIRLYLIIGSMKWIQKHVAMR